MSAVIDTAAQHYQAMPAASEASVARPGEPTGAVDVVSMLLSCFEKQLPERLMGNALALLRLLHAVDTVPQGGEPTQCSAYFAQCNSVKGDSFELHNVQDYCPGLCANAVLSLLQSVSTGGLYEGYYAYSAFQRYRMYWLPLLRAACYDGPHPQDRPCPTPPQAAAASQRSHGRVNGASNRAQRSAGGGSSRGKGPSHVLLKLPQPPLDVQWMWFLHRCAPDAYERDLNAACATVTAATAVSPSVQAHLLQQLNSVLADTWQPSRCTSTVTTT